MRKIILILLILTAFGVESVNAQKGLNNNSDMRVPINPNINTTTPLIRIIIPRIPKTPAIPIISPPSTILTADLLPAVPSSPIIPTGIDENSLGNSIATKPTTSKEYPNLPILPPFSPIPPMPSLRLPTN